MEKVTQLDENKTFQKPNEMLENISDEISSLKFVIKMDRNLNKISPSRTKNILS